MTTVSDFEIFLVSPPGLEAVLCAEVRALNFVDPKQVVGGVTVRGGWPEVWRANLEIRGATRVLARIGSFHAGHLAHSSSSGTFSLARRPIEAKARWSSIRAKGLLDHVRVDILPHASNLAISHLVKVCELGAHGFAGCLVSSGIHTEGGDFVAVF